MSVCGVMIGPPTALRLAIGACTSKAITDHGYMFGTYEFYAAATAAGIKPIIGVEAYMTPGTSCFDRTCVF